MKFAASRRRRSDHERFAVGGHAAAFVFDAYGTLFDVHAAIARHRAAAGPDADRFSEIWRTKQLEYTWTLTLAGRYVDFWTLTERALDYAFARVAVGRPALKPKLLDAYFDARCVSGCARRAGGAQGARRAHRASCRTARRRCWRPRSTAAGSTTISMRCSRSMRSASTSRGRRSMRWSPRRFEVAPADVVFVSSNRWDVMGAASFGFRCVWVNRAEHAGRVSGVRAPAKVVRDLRSIVDAGRSSPRGDDGQIANATSFGEPHRDRTEQRHAFRRRATASAASPSTGRRHATPSRSRCTSGWREICREAERRSGHQGADLHRRRRQGLRRRAPISTSSAPSRRREDALDYEARIDRVLGALEQCRVPTIAAITGACTGGGAAIAACCDLRIGTERRAFGFPIARTLGNCLSMANYRPPRRR